MAWLLLWGALAFGQHGVEDPPPIAEVTQEVADTQPETEPDPAPASQAESLGRVAPVLPQLPLRGFWSGVVLGLLALAFGGLMVVVRRSRRRLAAAGLLPSAAEITESAFRMVVLLFGLAAVAAWLPASLAPIVPWFLIFGAAAIGWSLRDVAQDAMAWMALSLEGRVRTGKWLQVDGFSGRVESVGLRCVVLHDLSGREITVPNRRLLREPVHADLSPWPLVEVELVLYDSGASDLRGAIREAVLLSPWVAPDGRPEVLGDVRGEGRWRVRARLLDGRFAASFEGSLRERVLEVLDGGRSEVEAPAAESQDQGTY